jgi:hypothetical protein
MNAKIEKITTAKKIARFSISIVVSTIAAKIVFIIFCSFTFFPIVTDSTFLGGAIFIIGAIAGISSGIGCFIKLNNFLKGIMKNI